MRVDLRCDLWANVRRFLPEPQLLGGRVIERAEQAPVTNDWASAMLPAPARPGRDAAVGSLLLPRQRPQPLSDFGISDVLLLLTCSID